MTNTTALVIVEDEPDIRLLIRMLLTQDVRLEVVGEATSAAGALELARSASPGLIVLDHSVDGPVTGLEAASSLKAAAPGVKIILFSAYDLAADARRSPDVDAYLPKDQPSKLLPLAQQLLGIGPSPA